MAKKKTRNGGKNKKNGKKNEPQEESRFKLDLTGDTARSVAAIFLFVLGIIMALGFLGSAGVLGTFLDSLAGSAIGWAKVIFPFFLFGASFILFFKKDASFYVSKLLTLSVILMSLLGIFHWFFSPGSEMEKAAEVGSGGGYVGFWIASLLNEFVGRPSSLIVLIAVIIITVILGFKVSFIGFFNKEDEAEDGEQGEIGEDDEEGSVKEGESKKKQSEKPEEEIVDPEENIKNVQFVEGPDQYIDENYLSNSLSKKISFTKKTIGGAIAGKMGKVSQGPDDWKLPPLDLLEKSSGVAKGGDVDKNAEIIKKTLSHFGIEVETGEIKTGPSVTQYSFRPAVGVKISKILSLQNDIALALAAHPIRIEAPIPGRSLIGIEVPNKVPVMVRLRDIMEDQDFVYRKSNLTLALGKDVSGSHIYGNLEKMPHLMIAGATGTGKSVSINTIITTLLYQNSPKDLKFIMVDPKRVELSLYNGIPHLLTDVIVDNNKVVNALKWAVSEMEKRYRLLQDTGSRDLESYKEKINGGKKRTYVDPETNETVEEELEWLPFIVIVIDELADLMGSHGKEVEGAIVRLAQMARAVGIHLIVSTQRPSVEVITGLIKANIITRLAFQVGTQIDSRTILDMAGAEKLLGNGDMLYLSASSPKPKRLQGVFVSESEVKRVVKFVKEQKKNVEEEIGEDIASAGKDVPLDFSAANSDDQEDELYNPAKEEILRIGKASASFLQRRFRIGYSRAARLLDALEEKGVIGPAEGAKPREVYGAKDQDEIGYEEPMEDQEKRDKWEM